MAKGRWRTVRGKTHSFGAMEAHGNDQYSITTAIEVVYDKYGCKQRRVSKVRVRGFLENHCGCGYHHVAGINRVREVRYYNTNLSNDQQLELFGAVVRTPDESEDAAT